MVKLSGSDRSLYFFVIAIALTKAGTSNVVAADQTREMQMVRAKAQHRLEQTSFIHLGSGSTLFPVAWGSGDHGNTCCAFFLGKK